MRTARGVRMSVASGIDWFELHGGATSAIEMRRSPTLLAALERGEDRPPRRRQLRAAAGGVARALSAARRPPAKPDGELAVPADASRRCSTRCSPTRQHAEIDRDAAFARARDELRAFEASSPADPPDGFSGGCAATSATASAGSTSSSAFGFGGCLADDMGLGKTVQVLALLDRRGARSQTPPTPAVAGRRAAVARFNWKQEAARFTPNLRVLDTPASTAASAARRISTTSTSCSPPTARCGATSSSSRTIAFDYVILDEAQAIKNASTRVGEGGAAAPARAIAWRSAARRSRTTSASCGACSSSSIPGMLGTAVGFRAGRAPAAAPMPTAIAPARASGLRPFILRRTKEQVANDLPEKTEQTIYCELEPAAAQALRRAARALPRTRCSARIDARRHRRKSKIQILEALLRLRQAACHPGLIDKAQRRASRVAKLDVLLPQLDEVHRRGTQGAGVLAVHEPAGDRSRRGWTRTGIAYAYLDGRTRDRQARVERFQNDPDCTLFLISLKAGGLGLNLTAADYVFLLDPWWNPAVEAQAIDRAHRIGQTRHVFAYRLIAGIRSKSGSSSCRSASGRRGCRARRERRRAARVQARGSRSPLVVKHRWPTKAAREAKTAWEFTSGRHRNPVARTARSAGIEEHNLPSSASRT